jgi:hypothetical protein
MMGLILRPLAAAGGGALQLQIRLRQGSTLFPEAGAQFAPG